MIRLLILTSVFIHIFTISQSEAYALVAPNVNLDVNGDLENPYPLLVDGGLRFQARLAADRVVYARVAIVRF